MIYSISQPYVALESLIPCRFFPLQNENQCNDERVSGDLLKSKSSFKCCVGAKNVVLGLSVKKGGGGSHCPILVKFPNYSGVIQTY